MCLSSLASLPFPSLDLRADYKVVARALTRKANVLVKQERYKEAVQVYHKSLTEHRRATRIPLPSKLSR